MPREDINPRPMANRNASINGTLIQPLVEQRSPQIPRYTGSGPGPAWSARQLQDNASSRTFIVPPQRVPDPGKPEMSTTPLTGKTAGPAQQRKMARRHPLSGGIAEGMQGLVFFHPDNKDNA